MRIVIATTNQILVGGFTICLELEAERLKLRHGNLLILSAPLLHLPQRLHQVFVDDRARENTIFNLQHF